MYIERSVMASEKSSMSATPVPIEQAKVDVVYFQNGLLKANISWTVANGALHCIRAFHTPSSNLMHSVYTHVVFTYVTDCCRA